MIKYAVAAVAAVMIAGAAQAAALSPTEIVQRHMAAAAKSDVDAIMGRLCRTCGGAAGRPGDPGQGGDTRLVRAPFPPRPAGSPPPAAGAPGMKVTRVWEEGNVGFATWQMGALTGTDEFLIRDGKIEVQAVFLSGAPPAR